LEHHRRYLEVGPLVEVVYQLEDLDLELGELEVVASFLRHEVDH
jgi:hypothetical protein